ncbi:MAG: CoA-binding protein [Bryobacteraceae bacterium]|jgi:hypothetical protein
MVLRQEIADFLGRKRIAVVGVSTEATGFSRALFKEFVARGYDVIPVNPKAEEIEGRRCYASVRDIDPKPEAVLIMTPAERTNEVVHECADSGVDSVWMYRAVGSAGAVSASAVEFCREHGMHVIPGECPFMFFPNAGLHAIHGWFHKMFSPALRQ